MPIDEVNCIWQPELANILKRGFRSCVLKALNRPRQRVPSDAVSVDHLLWGIRGSEELSNLVGLVTSAPSLSANLLGNHSWLKDSGQEATAIQWKIERYLRVAIEFQCGEGDLSFSEDRFAKFWQLLEGYVAKESFAWHFIAPIVNFSISSHASSVPLDSFLKIRRLEKEERDKLGKAVQPGRQTLWCVDVKTMAERGVSLLPASAERPVESVITALRLLKSPQVCALHISNSSDDPFDPGGLSWKPFAWTGHRGLPLFASDENEGLYVLEEQDILTLRSLWASLWGKWSTTRVLDIAVPRFNAASETLQIDLGKSLVDIWIALEALFLPDIDRNIRRTAATRISRFLADSQAQRQEVHDFIAASYRLRSALVHGERVDDRELGISTWRSLEILRDSLRSFVVQPDSFTVKDLDSL